MYIQKSFGKKCCLVLYKRIKDQNILYVQYIVWVQICQQLNKKLFKTNTEFRCELYERCPNSNLKLYTSHIDLFFVFTIIVMMIIYKMQMLYV